MSTDLQEISRKADEEFLMNLSQVVVLDGEHDHESLFGKEGRLRADFEDSDLGVDTDPEAVAIFLFHKAVSCSKDTLAAYRREAERLFMWLYNQHGVALSDMRFQDFLAYKDFLKDPQPRDKWVRKEVRSSQQKKSNGRRRRTDSPDNRRRTDPEWRIFKAPMTDKNVAYTFTIINHMMNWLVSHGHLKRNPIAEDKDFRRSKESRLKKRHALTDEIIEVVLAYIDNLPITTDAQIRDKARRRFLFRMIYGLGLRIGDLGNESNSMADFKRLPVDGKMKWHWVGISKGGSTDPIPCDSFMPEVERYRTAMGISPALPLSNDPAPGLVLSISGRRPIGANSVYNIFQDTIEEAANWEETNKTFGLDPNDISLMRSVSPHWLRHTNITHQLEQGVDLRIVQQNARHADPKTTMTYSSISLKELQNAGALKPKKERNDG